MKTARTLFLIARTHGYQSHLLKTRDFVRLLGVRGLKELVEVLLNSDYAPDLSHLTSEPTSLEMERIFYDKLSKRWYSLLDAAFKKPRRLLEIYDDRFEIENLKRIIRAAHGKDTLTEDQLIKIPRLYQKVNFPALQASNTVPEVVDLLRESPYKDIAGRLEEYERYNNPFLLEAYLDKNYYERIWNEIHRMRDARQVRVFIGLEADLRNLELIISSKYTRLDPSIVRESLIDVRHRLRKTAASRLINANVEEVSSIAVGRSYTDLLQKAVESMDDDKIVDIQGLFSSYLYSHAETTSIMNPNSLVYVFCYLQMCLREARNLTTLAIGKQLKMPEEKISSLLL